VHSPCRILHHTATYCNILQHTATCFNTATYINILQHTATHCNTLQHTATHCNTLHLLLFHSHCRTLQNTATHCNTLQHTATHYITLHLLLEFPTEPISCDRPYHSPGNMSILVTREKKTDFSMHLSYDPPRFEQVCCSVCCSVLQCVAARCPKHTRSTTHSFIAFCSNIHFTLDTDTTQTQHRYNTRAAQHTLWGGFD